MFQTKLALISNKVYILKMTFCQANAIWMHLKLFNKNKFKSKVNSKPCLFQSNADMMGNFDSFLLFLFSILSDRIPPAKISSGSQRDSAHGRKKETTKNDDARCNTTEWKIWHTLSLGICFSPVRVGLRQQARPSGTFHSMLQIP